MLSYEAMKVMRVDSTERRFNPQIPGTQAANVARSRRAALLLIKQQFNCWTVNFKWKAIKRRNSESGKKRMEDK